MGIQILPLIEKRHLAVVSLKPSQKVLFEDLPGLHPRTSRACNDSDDETSHSIARKDFIGSVRGAARNSRHALGRRANIQDRGLLPGITLGLIRNQEIHEISRLDCCSVHDKNLCVMKFGA